MQHLGRQRVSTEECSIGRGSIVASRSAANGGRCSAPGTPTLARWWRPAGSRRRALIVAGTRAISERKLGIAFNLLAIALLVVGTSVDFSVNTTAVSYAISSTSNAIESYLFKT